MDQLRESWREQQGSMPNIDHDQYTPEELANLLGISREVILHDVSVGELKATRVGHHTVSLNREDVLAWLNRRGGGV